MNVFLVVGSSPFLAQAVNRTYSDEHRYEIAPGAAWAVAGPELTTTEVCSRLGIGLPDNFGVVVKVDQYYGTFDGALWQKIEAWKLTA